MDGLALTARVGAIPVNGSSMPGGDLDALINQLART